MQSPLIPSLGYPLTYPELKQTLLLGTAVLGILLGILLWVISPEWVLPFLKGVLLGLGYLYTLCLTVETPKRGFTIFISITRAALFGFLIVYFGQFRLWETGVVFCGFLSYKIMVIWAVIRASIGIRSHRGQ